MEHAVTLSWCQGSTLHCDNQPQYQLGSQGWHSNPVIAPSWRWHVLPLSRAKELNLRQFTEYCSYSRAISVIPNACAPLYFAHQDFLAGCTGWCFVLLFFICGAGISCQLEVMWNFASVGPKVVFLWNNAHNWLWGLREQDRSIFFCSQIRACFSML